MKLATICNVIFWAAFVVTLVGSGINQHEMALLPTHPTPDRQVPIHVSKGPIAYGTQREYSQDEAIHTIAVGAIFVGIAAIAVRMKYSNRKK